MNFLYLHHNFPYSVTIERVERSVTSSVDEIADQMKDPIADSSADPVAASVDPCTDPEEVGSSCPHTPNNHSNNLPL